MRGLYSYKTRFKLQSTIFSVTYWENACTNDLYNGYTNTCLYQVKNMTVVIHSFDVLGFWFCHLIRDFPFLISTDFSTFVIFTFSLKGFIFGRSCTMLSKLRWTVFRQSSTKTNMAAPMENMNRLVKKKEEIEADIQALFEVLKSVIDFYKIKFHCLTL